MIVQIQRIKKRKSAKKTEEGKIRHHHQNLIEIRQEGKDLIKCKTTVTDDEKMKTIVYVCK